MQLGQAKNATFNNWAAKVGQLVSGSGSAKQVALHVANKAGGGGGGNGDSKKSDN